MGIALVRHNARIGLGRAEGVVESEVLQKVLRKHLGRDHVSITEARLLRNIEHGNAPTQPNNSERVAQGMLVNAGLVTFGPSGSTSEAPLALSDDVRFSLLLDEEPILSAPPRRPRRSPVCAPDVPTSAPRGRKRDATAMTEHLNDPVDDNTPPESKIKPSEVPFALAWSVQDPPSSVDGELCAVLHAVDDVILRLYPLWGWNVVAADSWVQGVCLPGVLVVNGKWFLNPALLDHFESITARWNHHGTLELRGDGLWLGTGRPIEELNAAALHWWLGNAMIALRRDDRVGRRGGTL